MAMQFFESGISRSKQKGTSLLEGMISMLLIATLGLSLMIVITNALNIQRFGVTESWVLMNLRNFSMTDESDMQIATGKGEAGVEWDTIPVTKTDVTRDVVIEIEGVRKTISVVGKQLEVTNQKYVSGDGLISLSP